MEEKNLTLSECKLIQPTSIVSILSDASDPFDFRNPPYNPEEFAAALTQKMKELHGVGLSAIQLGLPYRVFSVETEPNIVCFNPRIVELEGEPVDGLEGCLSFPGMILNIKRYPSVRMRFQDHTGTFITRKFGKEASRVIQHEMDHLNGKLFFNRANRYHRDKAIKKWENVVRTRALALNTQKESLSESKRN